MDRKDKDYTFLSLMSTFYNNFGHSLTFHRMQDQALGDQGDGIIKNVLLQTSWQFVACKTSVVNLMLKRKPSVPYGIN